MTSMYFSIDGGKSWINRPHSCNRLSFVMELRHLGNRSHQGVEIEDRVESGKRIEAPADAAR
jgi:hypothetical protein